MTSKQGTISRRSFFKRSTAAGAAVAAGTLVTNGDLEAVTGRVNTNSQPSDLKITDMRVVSIQDRHIIRLDTNQDIYGYGEVRDAASKKYALMLKSRILGENPCNVEKIFRKLKQFGHHGRGSAGVCAVEMAFWDLAGKAWGVPVWQMLGGKYRDKIRVYADTPSSNDPEVMGKRLKGRMERGFTFLKMDFGIHLLRDIEGTLTYPKGQGVDPSPSWEDGGFIDVLHPFTGIRVTEKGLDIMEEYVAAIRDIVGWEIPLASDHYGHFGIADGIKMAQRMDKYNLAWYEDVVAWIYTDDYVRLRNSCNTPILTGGNIYLREGFTDLFEKGAIDICQPDVATAGGILETKLIGDMAMKHGISMVIHMAGMPVTMFASVHCAAATENFLCMEHHDVDDLWYDDIVDGVPKPLMDREGFVSVPESPGLGIELNKEAVLKNQTDRDQKGYFEPTPDWDIKDSHDRTWS